MLVFLVIMLLSKLCIELLLGLGWLLCFICGLILLVGLILIYYIEVFINYWYFDFMMIKVFF